MKKFIFFMLLLTFSINIHARSCNDDEYDRVKYYADVTSKKIVREYRGGRHIEAKVLSCEYNSYSRQWKAKIEVKWHGEYIGANTYISRGFLVFDADNNHGFYRETYANSNLCNFRAFLQLLGYMEITLSFP